MGRGSRKQLIDRREVLYTAIKQKRLSVPKFASLFLVLAVLC
jgi:hypothetical protein